MKRKIIAIDEEKCTGCGECIPGCPEGAIQMIDGKARLISDLTCDGLGACLGHCPEGAITIEEREAGPYDERLVMGNIARQGPNVIAAHLRHLHEHRQTEYLKIALSYLRENRIANPLESNGSTQSAMSPASGCPGSRSMTFDLSQPSKTSQEAPKQASELRHWPIQLHLISPQAPQYTGRDLLLAADCVPFSMGNFHADYLKGKSLAIACPKLDQGQEIYLEKLVALIDEAKVNTITVIIMQVPCCGRLQQLAQIAVSQASRKVPVKSIIVGVQGEVLQENWV
jgi:NAD-dependent dihydropyrimidine dehydrogenase PreA subunit